MTIKFTARCDGTGCRHSTRMDLVGLAVREESLQLPYGWAKTTDSRLHACCGTCRKEINARRERMRLPALAWVSYLGKAYSVACADCSGTGRGRRSDDQCQTCRGTGVRN